MLYVIPVPDQIVIETGFTALDINQVFPEDTGTYTVIAKNIGGETRTSCLLTVEGLYPTGAQDHMDRMPVKPMVKKPLADKEVQEGARARLDCVIVGYPEPEVSWRHLL